MDPFEQLMHDATEPMAQVALAKRTSVILTAVFAATLTMLTLVPFTSPTGDLTLLGLATIMAGVGAVTGWLVTSVLHGLASGEAIDLDPLHQPPHYGHYWS